jgi:hypothetical protein
MAPGVTTRFTFTLRNLALLPLEYSWQSEGVTAGGGNPDGVLPADLRIRPEMGRLLPGGCASRVLSL